MRTDFFQKHKKLLSVLLVAVFVVGGGFYFNIKVSFAITAAEVSSLNQRYSNFNGWTQQGITQGGFSTTILGYGLKAPAGWVPSPNSGVALDQQGRLVVTDEAQAKTSFPGFDFLPIEDPNQGNLTFLTIPEGTTFVTGQGLKAGQNLTVGVPGSVGAPGVTTANNSGNEKGGNSLQDLLGQILSWVLYYIAVGLGWILMLLMKVMLIIAVFNNFLNVSAVQVGWTITRDICNNFFIIFMMVMAIGVTLKLPGYQWRSMLPKILIFAVLINFSKMFTGILIDFSQVLMLTFATPLATVHGYNLVLAAMGLPGGYQLVIEEGKTTGIDWLDIIAALLFVIIITIVAIVVVAVICVILVYRIIMLWFLVILSPLYFMAKATNISQLGQLSTEWMSNLSKMLIVGPAMMFFLYLSFLTMSGANTMTTSQGASTGNILSDNVGSGNAGITGLNEARDDYQPRNFSTADDKLNPSTGGKEEVSLSKMASPNGVINFLVVVGLLFTSLTMGQKFGDAAGKFAGQGSNLLTKWGKKATIGLATGAAKKVGAKTATTALGATALSAGILNKGVSAGLGRIPGLGRLREGGFESLAKTSKFAQSWRADLLKARDDKRSEKRTKLFKKIGMGDETQLALGELAETRLGKTVTAAAPIAIGALTGVGLPAALGMAIPSLVAAGAAYSALPIVAGGLMSAFRGTKMASGSSRAKRQKEDEKDAETIKLSEAIRDKDTGVVAAKNIRDTELNRIEKEKSAIENRNVNKNGRMTGNGLHPDVIAQLGPITAPLTDKEIDEAKKKVLAAKEPAWQARAKTVQSSYESNSAVITAEADHQTRLTTNLSERSRKKRQKKANLDTKKESELTDNKNDQEKEINDIEANKASGYISELEGNRRINKINQERDRKKVAIEEKYGQAKEKVDKPILDRAWDKFSPNWQSKQNPNWVTLAAVKKLKAELETAINQVSSLAVDGDIFGFKNKFYSSGGQTSSQARLFAMLSKNEKASADALNKMIETLQGISKPTQEQAKTVMEIKKGLAAYKGSGKSVAKFEGLITVLNKINTGDSDDKGTVEDWEKHVVKPK